MLKKIALYSVLFVVVAMSTAAVIVFLNRQPKFVEVNPPVIEEDMTLTNVMNATMSLENYQADICLTTQDKSVDLVGSLSVLDLEKNPSARLFVSGKVAGKDVSANVKFKDNCIYAQVNGFGIKARTKDLLDIFDVVSSLINPSASESFDVSNILAGLEGLQVDEQDDGYQLMLSIEGLGDISLFANTDYVPVEVHAENINVLGKQLTFSLVGQCGGAPNVSISSSEQSDFIDLSSCKNLITSAINSFTSVPIVLQGDAQFFGQTINVWLYVDKNMNLAFSLGMKNIKVNVTYYQNVAYVDVCGTKIVCTDEELTGLVAQYLNVDIEALVKEFKISEDSLSIAGTSINFTTQNNLIRTVQFENELVSGNLNVSYTLPSSIIQPTGYENALSVAQIESIFADYMQLLQQDDISFKILGNFGKTNLDLNGYVGFVNGMPSKVYVGNRINGMAFHVWNKYNATYLLVDTVKVKFDNTFSSNMLDYLLDKFDITLPNINDVVELLSEQIVSLKVSEDGRIDVELASGLKLSLYEFESDKMITIEGNILGEQLNVRMRVLSNNTRFKSVYERSLSPSLYTDLSSFGDMAQSVINSLTSEHTVLAGSLKLTGPKGKTTYADIGIKVETWFKNNELSLKVTLSNLPTASILTDLSSTKYKGHEVAITYSGGAIEVVRTATRKNGNVETKLQNTYSPNQLSAEVLFDALGFDGSFRKLLTNKINESSSNQTLNLNNFAILNCVDQNLVATLKTSKLAKQLSDLSLTIKTENKSLKSLSASMKLGSLNVVLTLNA